MVKSWYEVRSVTGRVIFTFEGEGAEQSAQTFASANPGVDRKVFLVTRRERAVRAPKRAKAA